MLGLGINGTKRIVQNENLRIQRQGAGDGQALLLAAGKMVAPFAGGRLLTLGEALNIPGQARFLSGGDQFLIA